MGLFDSIFGTSKARNDINAASSEAQRTLADAQARAEAALRASQGQSRSDINAGYDRAGGIYNAAQPGLENTLRSGYAGAREDLTRGYGAAEDAITAGRDRATGNLDPWVQSGRSAQDRYNAALGLNGEAAARDAISAGVDPYRQYRDELALKGVLRLFAGTGRPAALALAATRESQRLASGDLQTYLSRLEAAGQRGQQAAGQKAGYEMTAGQNVADIRSKLGTGLADNSINQGSALANLGSQFANARAGLETGRAGALSQNEMATGKAASDLIYGAGQQNAANRINAGNAIAATRTLPMSNLINLAGTAVQAGFLGNKLGFYGPQPPQTQQPRLPVPNLWPASDHG